MKQSFKYINQVAIKTNDLKVIASTLGILDRNTGTVLNTLRGFSHEDIPNAFFLRVIPALLGLAGTWVSNWQLMEQRIDASARGETQRAESVIAIEPAEPEPQRDDDEDEDDDAYELSDDDEGDEREPKRRRLHQMSDKLRYWRSRCKRWQEKAKSLEKELADLKSGGKKHVQRGDRTTCRFFTAKGGLSLALKRNACNTPSACMGMGLSIDAHWSTVCKWENVLDGCFRAAAKAFFGDMEATLSAQGGLVLHVLRSDATNAKCWHQEKLHVTEVRSVYSIRGSEETMESLGLGDLLVAKDGTADTCRALIQQQLKSCGVPPWDVYIQNEKALLQPFEVALDLVAKLKAQRANLPAARRITNFCQVTDAGSEQVATRLQIAQQCKPYLLLLHWHSNCLQPQRHLSYKTNLAVSEFALSDLLDCQVEYYSSLAKLVNVWREEGKKIYEAWQDRYVIEAMNVAVRAPARCLIGRWGSTHAAEKKVVACNPHHLRDVFSVVLAPKAKSTPRPKAEPRATDDMSKLTEMRDETTTQYRERWGRWGKEALEAINAPEWFVVLKISHRSRQPLAHLEHAMEKNSSANTS